MKNFLEKKELLSDSEIEELLYYFNQGIFVGKEETLAKIINNLSKLSYSEDKIAKIVDVDIKKLKFYLN